MDSFTDSFSEFKVERLSAPNSLTDRVCEALMQLIRGKELPPGSRLPSEMSMADRFGVSRTVIREAVSRLKSEGLVESRQGSGVFVREENTQAPFRIDPGIVESIPSILQVVELRITLEGEAAALAAMRRTDDQLEAIAQSLEAIAQEEKSGGDGVVADIAFHRSIAEATGNPHFLALIEFLFTFLKTATQVTRSYESTKKALSQEVKKEHAAILKAIAGRDAEAARQAARRHMEGASRRLAMLESREDWQNRRMKGNRANGTIRLTAS